MLLLGVTGQTAQASTLQVKHPPFNKMTRQAKISFLKKQIHRDKSVLRFYKNHPQIITLERTVQTHWAHTSLKIASSNLKKLTYHARIHSTLAGSDMSAWLCIHRYEGSWSDPNPPYWGGLQMDLGFQKTYGPEFYRMFGTADHWPIIDQIIAARRARDGFGGYGARGYSPWPNTARDCGLL